MYKPLKRFLTLTLAFAATINAGFAYDIAATKGGFNKKQNGTKKRSGGKSARKAYVWGTLGLSAVSEAIQKFHKSIVPRVNRKALSKFFKTPFYAHTTGKSYHQLPYQVGKQLQKANAYKAKLNSKKWKMGRAQ